MGVLGFEWPVKLTADDEDSQEDLEGNWESPRHVGRIKEAEAEINPVAQHHAEDNLDR